MKNHPVCRPLRKAQLTMGSDFRCVIFDFANTLCNTPYFWPLGTEFLSVVTQAIFTGDNKRLWAGPWCRGEICSTDIAGYLSGSPGSRPDAFWRGWTKCSI